MRLVFRIFAGRHHFFKIFAEPELFQFFFDKARFFVGNQITFKPFFAAETEQLFRAEHRRQPVGVEFFDIFVKIPCRLVPPLFENVSESVFVLQGAGDPFDFVIGNPQQPHFIESIVVRRRNHRISVRQSAVPVKHRIFVLHRPSSCL